MIQRIQSIFLFLAAACFFGLFGLPFASSDVAGQHFFSDQVYNIQDHVILTIMAVSGGILAFAAIFMYKNRTTQMRLGIFSIIAGIFILLLAFLFVYLDADKIGDVEISENFGIGLPVLSIIFVALANRFIKKDDKLVKSMDRLR